MHFSVCTFNICHNRGPTGRRKFWENRKVARERLLAIGQLVSECDFVVLQEVDFRQPLTFLRNDQHKCIKKISRHPYSRLFTSNYAKASGLVTLSRHPLTQEEVIPLPTHSFLEKTIGCRKYALACTATIRKDDGSKAANLKIVNVHLDHRGRHLTAPAVEELVRWTERQSLPVVMAGDFNATPLSFPNPRDTKATALDFLKQRGIFQVRPERNPRTPEDMTHPTTDPRCIIDWIFIPNVKGWRFTHYQVRAVHLSDHRPVFAEVSVS